MYFRLGADRSNTSDTCIWRPKFFACMITVSVDCRNSQNSGSLTEYPRSAMQVKFQLQSLNLQRSTGKSDIKIIR